MSAESPKASPARTASPGQNSEAPNNQVPQVPPFAFNGTFPPPPPPQGTYPPFLAYAPPSEGEPNSGGPGGPYILPFPPPGMVYAYPPAGQGKSAIPQSNQPAATPTQIRPKRKQVKMACTNCAAACKRCDEARPCDRCIKYGMADTCRDGQRKERKKGVKRGPYKRKIKTQNEEIAFHQADGEWVANQPPQGNPAAPTAMHAFSAHPPPPHEGSYYPYYLPPHPFPGFVPPPQGQEGNGDANGSQGGTGSFVVQYYVPHPPGGFPPLPYGHYAFPALPPQVVQQQQSQPQLQTPQQPQPVNATEGGGSEEEKKKPVDVETDDKKPANVGEKRKGKKSKGSKTGEENIAVDS